MASKPPAALHHGQLSHQRNRHLRPSLRSANCYNHCAPIAGMISTVALRAPSPCLFPLAVCRVGQLPVRRFASRRAAALRAEEPDEEELRAARDWLSKLNSQTIPRHICDVSFSRSSGPGGQNVNKFVSMPTHFPQPRTDGSRTESTPRPPSASPSAPSSPSSRAFSTQSCGRRAMPHRGATVWSYSRTSRASSPPMWKPASRSFASSSRRLGGPSSAEKHPRSRRSALGSCMPIYLLSPGLLGIGPLSTTDTT